MSLTIRKATNLAWIIGYGGMMLAGYQSHDHRYETYHHTHAPDDDPGTNVGPFQRLDDLLECRLGTYRDIVGRLPSFMSGT